MKHAAAMPKEIREQILPLIVVKLLSGGRVTHPYGADKESVCVHYEEQDDVLNIKDFLITKKIADILFNSVIEAECLQNIISSQKVTMKLIQMAGKMIREFDDEFYKNKKRILFIKSDDEGCGYWRMEAPAAYIDKTKWAVECSSAQIFYDYLLYYDVIVVQRIYRWDQYYLLERLKNHANKVVIYDLDDDIFHLPVGNKSTKIYNQSAQICVRHLMQLCDGVITTNARLSKEIGLPDKTFFLPNSVDLNLWTKDKPNALDWKIRIFWAGSATHEEDFKECLPGLIKIMKKHDDVRLTIVGFLPVCLQKALQENDFMKGRIEWNDFMETESYMTLLQNLQIDIGICPLTSEYFNLGKSAVKYAEMTAAGVPVIASNHPVYADNTTHNKDILLSNNDDEWFENLDKLVSNKHLRRKIHDEAWETVDKIYDIKKNSAKLASWLKQLMNK